MAEDLISIFVRRYVREQDFHQRVAELVGRRLEKLLKDANIRAITSWRAKRPDRLEKKLRERLTQRVAQGQDQYKHEDDIYGDIPDLAGARIALYFPNERDDVRDLMLKNFEHLRAPKAFPVPKDDLDQRSRQRRELKRFSGYAAEHYRVRMRKEDLSPEDTRFIEGRCEIQVASVLMHAWSEVEHDLEYKDLSGAVSKTESRLLDQINGLVVAGEIALEELRRVTVERIGVGGPAGNGTDQSLRDQYDLANWLSSVGRLARATPGSQPPAVGRADLAFRFLEALRKTTISDIERYRAAIEAATQDPGTTNSLAESLIEVVLEEDPKHEESLARARRDVMASEEATAPAAVPDAPLETIALGSYLQRWRLLERVLQPLSSSLPIRRLPHIPSLLSEMPDLDLRGVDARKLQRLRTRAVHGTTDGPTAAELFEGARLLEDILKALSSYTHESAPEGLQTAAQAALQEIGRLAQPQGEGPPRLEFRPGPAVYIVARQAFIIPLTIRNPGDRGVTISSIRLSIGNRIYVPSMPQRDIVVTGLLFREVGEGIRLDSWDGLNIALFFPVRPDDDTIDPVKGDPVDLQVESVGNAPTRLPLVVRRSTEGTITG